MNAPSVTFRSITPMYWFSCWKECEVEAYRCGGALSNAGQRNYASYTIRVLHAPSGTPEFQRLVEWLPDADEFLMAVFQARFDHYYLVVDVVVDADAVERLDINSQESVQIDSAIKDALMLTVRGGFYYMNTFMCRNPPFCGVTRTGRLGGGGVNPFIPRESSLCDADWPSVVELFKVLLERPWEGTRFGRVLDLAMASVRLFPASGDRRHALMLLLMALEAAFKRDGKENFGRATRRVRDLVSDTRNDNNRVKSELSRIPVLRNMVAHGDPDTDDSEVAEAVLPLLHYLQAGMSRLILRYTEDPPDPDDYYDWLDRCVRAQQLRIAQDATLSRS